MPPIKARSWTVDTIIRSREQLQSGIAPTAYLGQTSPSSYARVATSNAATESAELGLPLGTCSAVHCRRSQGSVTGLALYAARRQQLP